MKIEEFENLSYSSRKEIVELRNWARQVLNENDDLIWERNNETLLHEFFDKTGKFAFNIQFAKPNEAAATNYYKVYYRPSSLTNNIGESGQFNFEQIRIAFSNWINYLEKLQEITEEYFNPYKQFYDTEFQDFFSNDDADASTFPFDKDRQEILFYFLSYAENEISISEQLSLEAKKELKDDIQKLKESIPALTKKETVKSLSKIAQKIKSFSNSLFHSVFDVMKKEAIKAALYKGIDYTPHVIDTIKGWLELL